MENWVWHILNAHKAVAYIYHHMPTKQLLNQTLSFYCVTFPRRVTSDISVLHTFRPSNKAATIPKYTLAPLINPTSTPSRHQLTPTSTLKLTYALPTKRSISFIPSFHSRLRGLYVKLVNFLFVDERM